MATEEYADVLNNQTWMVKNARAIYEGCLRREFGIPDDFEFSEHPALVEALDNAALAKYDHHCSGTQYQCFAYDHLVTQFAMWMARQIFK